MKQGRLPWLKTNKAVGFIGILGSVCLVAYLLLTPQTFLKLSDGFYLGFFPFASIVLLMATSFILTIDSRRDHIPPELADLSLAKFISVLIIGVIAWLYFWSMRSVGFLVVTPVLLGVGLYALGCRSRRQMVLSVVIFTLLGYLLVRILDLPSLLGPLGQALSF